MNKNMILSQFTKIMTHENKVIIGSRKSGKWLKISKECFDILELAINEKASSEQLIEAFESNEDKEYFLQLLQLLYKENILVENEENSQLEKGFSIDVAITNRCNLRCTHCCVDSDLTNFTDPMDTETLKDVLNKVVKCKPKSICLTGGEPMLRKDFFEVLYHLNNIYDGEIRVMTNGTFITSNNVKDLITHVSAIDISIDGINEETCSVVRGKGVFNKVLNSIDLLKSNGFDKISLSMVLTKGNYELRNEFQQLNEQLGTRGITRAFSPIGRAESNKDVLQPKEKEIEMEGKRFQNLNCDDLHVCTCGALIKELYINYMGKIYPCGLLENDKYCIGDVIKIEDLNNFLENETFKKSEGYKNWIHLQPDKHEKCKDCNVNLFCWNCLHYLELVENNEYFFEKVCPELKRNLQGIIWGDVKCS